MSIDLEWPKLDATLANYLVDVLNRQLTNAERPSFIGPVEVTSLEFGSAAPDVELVDLRDIYRDFLEDDDDSDLFSDPTRPVKVTEGLSGGLGGNGDDDDGFEWVPRRAAGREYEGIAHSHLPPHLRYPIRSSPTDTFSSMPQFHSPMSMGGLDMWTGHGALFQQPHLPPPLSPAMYRSPSPSTPFPPGASAMHTPPSGNGSRPISDSSLPFDHLQRPTNALFPPPPGVPTQEGQQQQNPHPNLQLHLQINWHSNLRITITTSLLINYPSPMFMSLPIKLSVTGLVFNGELAVAYEGERRRVHVCILDELDPYGPASDRPKREPTNVTHPELDEDSPPSSGRPQKPLPVGQRLLPSIFIESEIGQTDKHVLKNVNKVELFIQNVIRKTVEEELVFPNFHTLVMGDGQ